MIKNKINVIDLDETLIPYDSYSIYIKWPLRNAFYYVPGLILIILRKLRIISLFTQKKLSIRLNQKIKGYDEYNIQFANQLFRDIDKKVLKMVLDESDEKTINILCTASPYDYASLLADKLDWECLASHISKTTNTFIHLYDFNKIDLINKNYPLIKYDYNFAVSDSSKDLKLLEKFKKYVLYNRNN